MIFEGSLTRGKPLARLRHGCSRCYTASTWSELKADHAPSERHPQLCPSLELVVLVVARDTEHANEITNCLRPLLVTSTEVNHGKIAGGEGCTR